MDRKYHVISTLVEDKPGVLQKVAGINEMIGEYKLEKDVI